jgi:myogenesis-regulating glycosidase
MGDAAVSRSGSLSFALSCDIDLQVDVRPFALRFLRCGTTVVETEPTGAAFFRRGGREARSRRLRGWNRAAHDVPGARADLELLVSTEMTGVDLLVRAHSMPGHVLLSIRCSDETSSETLGLSFRVAKEDLWFGGEVLAASQWPLSAGPITRDPFLPTGNQAAPLWLSSRGAAVFKHDYQPLGFSFHSPRKGAFRIHAREASVFELCLCAAKDIREAHRAALRIIGVPRRAPPPEYFRKPAFSTWIEFLTTVHQEGVLDYVEAMSRSRFPCGVLMIDDKWMQSYGDLEFDGEKFPDPARMVAALHEKGIRVALWVTPFVDSWSSRYAEAREKGYLLRKRGATEPFLGKWWNGQSALIDFSNPAARGWFLDGLQALVRTCGVDGFKLDAGDAEFIAEGYDSHAPMNPWEYTDAFASLGAEFEINELRVSWLTQKLGLVQRLRDKAPTWSRENGLGAIVSHGLYEGLLGYPYFCADMIGGGWDQGFRNAKHIDEELFVRWTQASALFPIMQFSHAPWRLSENAAAICRRYVSLHEELADYTYGLAQDAARDATPIVRPLFFNYPEEAACYRVRDQFLLGDRFLAAPVVTRGARHRPVYLPAGKWRDYWSGTIFAGPRLIRSYAADLETLPLFERTEG